MNRVARVLVTTSAAVALGLAITGSAGAAQSISVLPQITGGQAVTLPDNPVTDPVVHGVVDGLAGLPYGTNVGPLTLWHFRIDPNAQGQHEEQFKLDACLVSCFPANTTLVVVSDTRPSAQP